MRSIALCLALVTALFSVAGNAQSSGRFIVGATISDDADGRVKISVQLACQVQYVDHLPTNRGTSLRIRIDPTSICPGASPTINRKREQYRPLNADLAKLVEIDYDGAVSAPPNLLFAFSDDVRFEVAVADSRDRIIVTVHTNDVSEAPTKNESGAKGIRVRQEYEIPQSYVINLSSSRTSHTAAERIIENVSPDLQVFETQVELAGVVWYRLRLGTFDSAEAAKAELANVHVSHPHAWIDRQSEATEVPTDAVQAANTIDIYGAGARSTDIGLDEVDELMAEARLAIASNEISRAVQLYTKVLRAPNHDRHAEAQELLGVAREKNGQSAHAKAEYQRYLSLYPDGDAAIRVQQRLGALLAISGEPDELLRARGGSTATAGVRPPPSDWLINAFWSQYYRRDVNQVNEEDEIVSQSAIYTDFSFDARRRGSRFDFGSRLSAGYRSDLLGKSEGSGDQLRVSYAYADLADRVTRLRGRIGRQSRNTGGVLGRFDGLNLDYRATERVLLNAVIGQPVNSATDGLSNERSFYGLSMSYGPIIENLEFDVFVLQQDINGLLDRQAVGAEFRYFGQDQNIWGLIDYDTSYNEISSAYLQGSWRIASRLTITAAVDQRHSPYLSLGSAMVGQPVEDFSELQALYTESEIEQLSIDRTPLATSITAGFSLSLTPRLQLSMDMNRTEVGETPESGGVPGNPESTYNYLATTLAASSLLTEGDVTIFGLRHSESDSSKVTSISVDSRFPIGRRWRINPRLRVDRRSILSDNSDEWLYTPGIRIQYRRSRKLRFEVEAGKQFAQRQLVDTDLDRESYFINVGYQVFF